MATITSISQPLKRKPNGRMVPGKRLSDDEFMAASIGDVEWLRQSLKDQRLEEVRFDPNGLASIHLAAVHGRLNCLRYLVEKRRVDVNLASATGWRAIHLCISNQTGKRAFTCLSYLLEKGANPSVANDDGVTPVHQASSEGHFQCLKLLIDLGADIFSKDCRDQQPLDLAKLWGHRHCARILATEMWHREKDTIGKAMREIKRLQLREALDRFEKGENVDEKRRFNGEEKFKDWMQKTNSKCNSQLEKSKNKSPDVAQNKAPVKPKVDKQLKRLINELTSKDAQTTKNKAENEEKIRPVVQQNAYNSTSWNFSTHVPSCFYPYQKILADVYPRDPLTLMPHPKKSCPVELNIRCQKANEVLQNERDLELLQSLAKPQIPLTDSKHNNVMEHMYSEEYSPIDRQQLFSSAFNILDAQSKRKWTLDEVPAKPEIQLHLSSDVTSLVFQSGLVKPRRRPESSGVSSTSSKDERKSCSLPEI